MGVAIWSAAAAMGISFRLCGRWWMVAGACTGNSRLRLLWGGAVRCHRDSGVDRLGRLLWLGCVVTTRSLELGGEERPVVL